jgi:hypothetical protein
MDREGKNAKEEEETKTDNGQVSTAHSYLSMPNNVAPHHPRLHQLRQPFEIMSEIK